MAHKTLLRIVAVVSIAISATLAAPISQANAATTETRTFAGTAFVRIGSVQQAGCFHNVAQTATITISRPGRRDWQASFQGCAQIIGSTAGFGGPLTMTTARPTHLYGNGAIFGQTSGGNLTVGINITGSDGEFVSGQLVSSFAIGSVGFPMTGSLVVQTQ
jgi:hypothetical protein